MNERLCQSEDLQTKAIGIIPARYQSVRLPGKPLLEIGGKPMILWVAQNASRSKRLQRIIVATDDERIQNCISSAGIESLITPIDLSSGTDRVAFVAREFDVDIIVNIQGDEPFIDPDAIDACADLLIDDPNAMMGTLVKRLTTQKAYSNPDVVKVVTDLNHHAMYFSRSPIPHIRGGLSEPTNRNDPVVYEHIGVYSFRKTFLLDYASWKPTALEKTESLEQLRALERGYQIKVVETEYESLSVDTEADLERARKMVAS